MKILTDPFCSLCQRKEIGTLKHLFWECPPVVDFWRQVAGSLTGLFGVPVPCSPGVLIFNGFSQFKLKMAKKPTVLAELLAAKTPVATQAATLCISCRLDIIILGHCIIGTLYS